MGTTSQRTALVTGASAGIGETFARYLAAQGLSLVLVARRREKLQRLASDLEALYGTDCLIVPADLADAEAPAQIQGQVEAAGWHVDVLINNAGFSGHYQFCDEAWENLHREIQVMITALTELCHRFASGMRDRGYGRIVNLSSLAAFAPAGPSLLYTGIKSYVLNMSQSLDMELKPHGVNVTALCPGFTWSEFHDVMGTRQATNQLPSILWMQPKVVVEQAWQAVEKGQPVCTPGWVNKTVAGASRVLPERLRYWLGSRTTLFD